MVIEVRPYMHKAILLLVEAHVKVNDTAPTLTARVLEALVTGLTETAYQSFQQIPKFGTGGMLTVSPKFGYPTSSSILSSISCKLKIQN